MKKAIFKIISCSMFLSFAFESVALDSPGEPSLNNELYASFINFQDSLQNLDNQNKEFFKNLDNEDPNLKEKLLKYKVNLESRLNACLKIEKEISNLKVSEQIASLKNYLKNISDMIDYLINKDNPNEKTSNKTDNQTIDEEKEKSNQTLSATSTTKEINWKGILLTEKLLKGLNNVITIYDVSYDRVTEWGYKFFENNDSKQFFYTNQNIPPSLKNMFDLIYNTRYPEAAKDWNKIRYISDKDEKYPELLDSFRKHIKSLLKNVSSLIRQHKKLESTNSQSQETPANTQSERTTQKEIKEIEVIEKLLKDFNNAVGTYDIPYNRVIEWGHKFFDKDTKQIFDPTQNLPSDLIPTFEVIYETNYPEINKVWEKIRYLSDKDPDYPKTLDLFRKKIKTLLNNVSKLVRGYKKSEEINNAKSKK